MTEQQNFSADFIDLLQCPEQQDALQLSDNSLCNESASAQYPLVSGIPWLLPHPQNSLNDWSAKLNHFSQVILSEIKTTEQNLKRVDGETEKRLQRLYSGKQTFLKRVAELLLPMAQVAAAQKNIYDALRDRAPTTQNLLSYEANLYRDWVWGEEENALTASLVSEMLSADQCDKMLVIAAGAGRLALDLHDKWAPSISVATDINPLLLLSLNHLLNDADLPFVEFPLQPRKSEYVAIEHEIKGQVRPSNFYLAFADATKPSFKAAAFDTLVTPWFIDIQPLELGRLLKQLNHYLPIGGHWINFGSLVFNQNRDALCYGIDEVKAVALQNGFEICELQEHEIPYLKSPYNAGYRMERVWLWKAKKIADVKALKNPQVLPPWILDNKQAIPKAPYLQQFSFTHRVYAQLAAEVDGKTSITKIARKMAKQNRMDENEALHLVGEFFLDLHRQNS